MLPLICYRVLSYISQHKCSCAGFLADRPRSMLDYTFVSHQSSVLDSMIYTMMSEVYDIYRQQSWECSWTNFIVLLCYHDKRWHREQDDICWFSPKLKDMAYENFLVRWFCNIRPQAPDELQASKYSGQSKLEAELPISFLSTSPIPLSESAPCSSIIWLGLKV